MGDLGFTQDDLDRIKAAYARGERKVVYQDKELTYRDLPEMERAMMVISRDLGINTAPLQRRFTTRTAW